ncbi:MAG: glycosyltransferase family 2 protein [Lentisphaeria bacterium]|jgi:glycosyltransferase involved in cell wall biosynthesis
MPDTAKLDLSVVIPVFNERDNLAPLLEELAGVLQTLGKRYEVILVDDCSTDDSVAVARQLQKDRPWLRLIRHRVNSGESAAGATGFRFARAEFIVTMDADMQNDPHDLPAFLAAMPPGIAAVCGDRRATRKAGDNWVRQLSSKLANGFRNRLTGEPVADAGCTYRLLRRACLHDLPVFNGLHRFIPTILRYQGYAVAEVPIHNRPRTRGVSKYGIGNRLWRGIRDCFAMRWYRRRAIRGDRVLAAESDL